MESVDERVESALVPDPSMSDSEYIYQRARKPNNPNVGKVVVARDMATVVGGLWRVRSALEHHKRAAAWFKSEYEALYGGGYAPAVDAGKVRVDTSIVAHDNGQVDRIDRARDFHEVREGLKKINMGDRTALDRVVACIILGIPCDEDADMMPSGQRNQRQASMATQSLLAALDLIAEWRGWMTRKRSA